jgi:DnaJ-class molecular chaperone
LPENADAQSIKGAYRTFLRVWHPDRFPNNPDLLPLANAKTAELNHAFQVLSGTKDATGEPQQPRPKPRRKRSASKRRTRNTKDISTLNGVLIILLVLVLCIIFSVIFFR